MKLYSVRLLSIIAIVFGCMTVVSGSTVLFSGGVIQEAAGSYVEFVVWFNLFSGVGYVISGYGLWKMRKWAAIASTVMTVSIFIVLALFSVHVIQGGQYETRTFYALIFRLLFWLMIAVLSRRISLEK